ncbi:hypothetical protein JRQ81_014309 [Phrynocephalus forsythii]|uniref:MRG-binding protein n=1 Tax=Phrynocephalus forsythii TaxID=171643 RepID=A0A9Q1B3C9_9SAUR|nr:hypothetical protein JRQ81_014309 [Phrynocephalus forsythii]
MRRRPRRSEAHFGAPAGRRRKAAVFPLQAPSFAGRPAGAAPVPSGSPPARPFLRAAARMGEAESSAGAAAAAAAAAAAGKLPCPAIGPGPASAPPEQPVPQAAPEEAAAAASISISASAAAAAAAATTPAVAATMTTTAAAAAMTPTPAAAAGSGPAPPPPPLPVPVVWSPEVEVCLFHAMLGHKPVGVNRHFHMICIRDKFSQNIGRQISSKVIWDHLSTMYDMQALHESEILPFPNSEKNFILPEEIIQEVKEGKVMTEEDIKEEIKEEMESHAGSDEVYVSLGSLAKAAEKPSNKEKERSSSESGSKEGGDKRKRNRVTEKVLNANSNPSSPSAAKRRRT